MSEGRINGDLKRGFQLFFKPYLEGYRERVNTLYSDEHTTSTVFTYMKPIHLQVLLRDRYTYLLFSKCNEDKLSFIDCTEIIESEFDLLSSKSDKLKNNFIESLVGLNDYIDAFHFARLGEFAGVSFTRSNSENLPASSKKWGVNKADDDYNSYNLGLALEKAFSPSIELTTVNTDEILERIQDPAFQYEFGESAKAYNAGLYLAAASTGGIALENILRLIIVNKMRDNKLPAKSFIRDSVLKLDQENILPGRLRSRVWEKSGIRNSHSHTNEDPVRKETVESLHQIIEDLVPYTS